MADRLAHEVGNALVPLSTHQQLLAEKFNDKEFRESLNQALADGVKRVTRLPARCVSSRAKATSSRRRSPSRN